MLGSRGPRRSTGSGPSARGRAARGKVWGARVQMWRQRAGERQAVMEPVSHRWSGRRGVALERPRHSRQRGGWAAWGRLSPLLNGAGSEEWWGRACPRGPQRSCLRGKRPRVPGCGSQVHLRPGNPSVPDNVAAGHSRWKLVLIGNNQSLGSSTESRKNFLDSIWA